MPLKINDEKYKKITIYLIVKVTYYRVMLFKLKY